MNMKMGGVALWLIIGVAVLMVSTGASHPAADPNRQISDALKYLQELDRIYAHVAMPSVGTKSVLVVGSLRSDRAFSNTNELTSEMENAISMLKLHELDKLYSDRIRPRFGKRTEMKHSVSDYDGPFQSEESDKDWLPLSNGR